MLTILNIGIEIAGSQKPEVMESMLDSVIVLFKIAPISQVHQVLISFLAEYG